MPPTLRQSLALALDPSGILRMCGMDPDPWQRRLLVSQDRQILLNCSRQAGKSTTVAVLALHTALMNSGSLILLLSPSLRQSVELFRKLIQCYNKLERPVQAAAKTLTQLELVNRSRVVSLPGQELTIRSFSGVAMLVIDEAARVPDDLYRSVRPMLAVSRGRLICLSTPFGRRGFFHAEWTSTDATWQRVQITWKQCRRIDADFIENELRSLGESWVRQEYLCSFEALEGLVYPDFEARAADERWPLPSGKAVGGLDFGFRNPFCALWGVLDRDDVLWIGYERYLREKPIHEHAAALSPAVSWYADPAGRTEIEELRHAGLRVRKGNNDVQAGIAAVTARLRTGRLKVFVPGCVNLIAESKLYRYPGVRDGQATSEIPIDDNNHALAALRYLVSRIDAGFIARFRKQPSAPRGDPPETDSVSPQAGADLAPRSPASNQPRLSLANESLWTPMT